LNIYLPDSELPADAAGWSRAPVWDYDSASGYQGEDRVGRAFGARYVNVERQRNLDLCVYVAMARFEDGGARYSVARTYELYELRLPREVEIPVSWSGDIEYRYPGKIDCDSAIQPLEEARKLILADFRQDPLFTRFAAL